MTLAPDLQFEFAHRGPYAVLLRRSEPWPRHVTIGHDWLEWAGNSAWVQREPNGGVWLRPTDTAPALYRFEHAADGDDHYRLVAVGDPPRFV
jgi:hypothetical protein